MPSLFKVAKWPRDKPETACPPLFCKLFGINWKEAGTKIKLQSAIFPNLLLKKLLKNDVRNCVFCIGFSTGGFIFVSRPRRCKRLPGANGAVQFSTRFYAPHSTCIEYFCFINCLLFILPWRSFQTQIAAAIHHHLAAICIFGRNAFNKSQNL